MQGGGATPVVVPGIGLAGTGGGIVSGVKALNVFPQGLLPVSVGA